ncbi:MAG: hypothetical protein KKG92_05490, partial [Gammaproteobacteria bacterium]|nr:hypothetical protein [Gammaproteobacteria bacterium]
MFTRFIARLLMGVIFMQAVLIPAQATAAVVDMHGRDKTWGWWSSGLTQNWVRTPALLNGGHPTAAENIWVPKDNWAEIGVDNWKVNTRDQRMIDVPEWIANNNVSLGRGAVDGMGKSNRRVAFDGSYVQAWAAYDAVNATARITLQKVEKGIDNRIHVYVADWTPWHGRHWEAAREYMTPYERGMAINAGRNPFRLFQADPDVLSGQEDEAAVRDPLWHNISFQGVQVALGHAMQHYQAHFGLIYIPDTRFDQNQSCSSSFFKKKCTTTVKGFAKPKWYLAVPKNMDSTPMEAMICIHNTAETDGQCLAPEWVARSGVSVREWVGGNLPVDEEMLYQWSQTKSSLNVLAIGVLLAIVTMGIGLAMGMPMFTATAGTGGAAAGGGAAGATAGATAMGAGNLAWQVGNIYITGNQMAGNGASEAQNTLFGQTGDGLLTPNLGAMGEQAQGLAAALAPKMRQGVIGAGTLTGARKMAYGDCRDRPGQVCAAGDPGLAQRPQSYRERNFVLEM